MHTEKRNDQILKLIKNLSISYEERENMTINSFNVIPCSTIYLLDNYHEINSTELEEKLTTLLSRYTAKNIAVLCINKKEH